MGDKWQIKLFLNEFRSCWLPKCYVVLREKNQQSLIELGLTPKQRRDIILGLTFKDCVEGPIPDEADPNDTICTFGKKIDTAEIYIKLKIYHVHDKHHAKCLSFHKAEASLKYPYK